MGSSPVEIPFVNRAGDTGGIPDTPDNRFTGSIWPSPPLSGGCGHVPLGTDSSV